jgi:hypothetical protein
MIDQTADELIFLGNRAVAQGNVALARGLYEEGLAVWRALGDTPCIAHALKRLRLLDGSSRPTRWSGEFDRSNGRR